MGGLLSKKREPRQYCQKFVWEDPEDLRALGLGYFRFSSGKM
jgi:hypothetical protein